MTAVPPKMVPHQELHLKKDRERDKDARAPVGISLCLSTSWLRVSSRHIPLYYEVDVKVVAMIFIIIIII